MRFLLLALAMLGPVLPALGAPVFQEDFARAAPGGLPEDRWDLLAGQWAVRAGALRTPGKGMNMAYAFGAPELDEQTITATITLGERTSPGSWAHAGLQLAQDVGNYWHLVLVIAPDGTRYGELAEQYDQQWQAQAGGVTQLPREGEPVSQAWGAGKYRLTLQVRPGGIRGEIRSLEGGELVYRGGYRFPAGTPAVQSGRVAVKAIDLPAAISEITVTSEHTGKRAAQRQGRERRAAVLEAALPGMPAELPKRIAGALQAAGLQVDLLAPEAIADRARFSADRYLLLAVPQCHTFPAAAREGMLGYLRGGGNLLAFGGPLCEQLLYAADGHWLTVQDLLAQAQPAVRVVAWPQQQLSAWSRATSHPQYATRHAVVPEGPGGAPVLRMDIPHLDGWDTFKSPPIKALAPDQNLTIFRARASEKLTALVEWTEEDGTRWLAPVRLGPEWKRCTLALSDFTFWADGSPKNRGGRGDRPRPEHLSTFSIGLAQGHGSFPSGGPYTLWVGEVGTARSPLGPQPTDRPTIETMSPPYKVYRTQASGLGVPGGSRQALPRGERLAVVCPIPRARGLGLQAPRPGRWLPLLEAWEGDQYRGAVASTYVSFTGPFRNATWTSIGLPDSRDVLRHFDTLAPLVTGLARRLAQDLWLVKGGVDRFSYFPEEPVRAGLQVANFAGRPRQAACALTVREVGSEKLIWEGTLAGTVAAGASVLLQRPIDRPLAPGCYRVRAVLEEGGRAVDSAEHEFRVLAAPGGGREQVVTQHDGDFWLEGKRWYPHGINYWPSNATALAPFEYWLHWLSSQQYDPEVVERDLAHLEALGANVVSIQLHNREQLPAMNDFLARAQAHGILTNIFLSGAHPLSTDLELCTGLVREGRFAGNPGIFAYDLAWEPALGDANARHGLDRQWADWVQDRYGSVAAAEQDWGMSAPRNPDGTLSGPSQEQILGDGEQRQMVAAFRRFVDDTVSAGYNRVIRALREADDTHLFGARTGYGGTGQEGVDQAMPFDLVAGAKHLDFTSPEGYGLNGAWENFEAGGFTTLYGRWAGQGRPVFWAEFGYTIYPETTPERYREQGALYRNTYRMLLESGANGSAGWWFPGGLRIGENSDFGMMNPDGTPRLSALALREAAPQIRADRPPPVPDYLITINRDLHPRGYSQIWGRHREEYVRAAHEGRHVGLRTEGTGTTSADCSPVAVGDVPWNGSNPPKYLNGEFNTVRREGDRLVVSLGNTGEATWLSEASAAGRPGAVYLVVSAQGREVARAPLPQDVPRYGDVTVALPLPASAPAGLELRLVAEGRTRFGPGYRVE